MQHSRKTRFWNLALIGLALLAAACAVVLTLVMEKAESRFGLRKDLTDAQLYSIGDTTRDVLDSLNTDLTIYTLYESGSEDQTVTEILRKYAEASHGHITVTNIDPIGNPTFTSRYEQNGESIDSGALIVQDEGSDEFRVINASDLYEWKLDEDQLYATGMAAEQKITAAIKSIQGGAQPKAYFVTGQGEMSMEDAYYLSGSLESDGYDVESYNLIYNDKSLEPSDTLLFLGPTRDLSDEEYEVAAAFAANGGKIVALIDPRCTDVTNFNRLFALQGLGLTDRYVVESGSDHYLNYQTMLRPILNGDSEVLRSVAAANAELVLPLCRALQRTDTAGVTITDVMTSSDGSYGKTDLSAESLDRAEGDTDGPFLLGAMAENTATGAKTVLLGCSYFVATLDNAKYGGNVALFMDSVAWASGKEDSVVIEVKSLVTPPLQIPSTAAGYRLMVLMIVVLPGLILLAGALNWRRRVRR